MTFTYHNMSDMMNGNNGSLELSIDDQTGVAVMSIANRDKRNALNPYIMAQLSDAISRLEKWANVSHHCYSHID